MNTPTNRWILTILACLAVSVTAGAQAIANEEGEVVGQNVYVRSQSTVRAYPVGRLSNPARVIVVDSVAGWLKIVPPPGVFSIVHKDYVELAANGQTGTITGENVRVRCGTDQVDLGECTKHWAAQRYVNTGDVVTIVGQGTDFYKIAPPQGAYVWISAQYVRRLTGEPFVRGVAPVDAGGPVEPVRPADPVEPVEPVVPTPPVDPSISSSGESIAAFQAAERQLVAEFEKPYDQRNFQPILASYQAINATPGSPLAGEVVGRIAFVNRKIANRRRLAEAQAEAARMRAMDESLAGARAQDEQPPVDEEP